MLRLRDSRRTSLSAPQQHRNPQPESIARNRYDKALAAVQPGQKLGDARRRGPEGEIAEMPHVVLRRDRRVPALDQRGVMGRDRGERPPVDAQDARVAEMGVAGEERGHRAGSGALSATWTRDRSSALSISFCKK